MARKPKPWPVWMQRALQDARDHGAQLVQFGTEEQCRGARLTFYKFLAEVREQTGHELHGAANTCTVQWVCAAGSRVRSVLRFVVGAVDEPVFLSGESASAVDNDAEVERALANLRKEFK